MNKLKDLVLPVIIMIVAAFGGMSTDDIPQETLQGNEITYIIDY